MADRRGRMSTPAWVMDFTSNAAETFVTAYYAASDSPQRTQLLPSLYLPTSSISWNGNPISGAAQYEQLLDAQPGSKHEIQSFDCHPLSACVSQAGDKWLITACPLPGPDECSRHTKHACVGGFYKDSFGRWKLAHLADGEMEPPSLLVTVSGTVGHYTPESLAKNSSNAPKSATATGGAGKRKFDTDAPIESHPRVFSQTFVLVNGAGKAAEGGVPFVWTPSKGSGTPRGKGGDSADTKTVAKYYIQADNFRFVG